MAGSSKAGTPKVGDLLEYNEAGSDATSDRVLLSGVADLVELAAEDEAVEEAEENEGKTDPSTRFAFSLEASFLNSELIREGFWGDGGCGTGRRSKGTKPAGSRVMCIECGLRCLGLQGGSGNWTCCVFSARRFVGV